MEARAFALRQAQEGDFDRWIDLYGELWDAIVMGRVLDEASAGSQFDARPSIGTRLGPSEATPEDGARD